MGRQRGAIERFQPTGLSTAYQLLPQMLKKAGYKTHAVGKWHLGYCNKDFLPTRWELIFVFVFLQILDFLDGVLTLSSECTSSQLTTDQGNRIGRTNEKNSKKPS